MGSHVIRYLLGHVPSSICGTLVSTSDPADHEIVVPPQSDVIQYIVPTFLPVDDLPTVVLDAQANRFLSDHPCAQ